MRIRGGGDLGALLPRYVEELRVRRFSASSIGKARFELPRLIHHLRENGVREPRQVGDRRANRIGRCVANSEPNRTCEEARIAHYSEWVRHPFYACILVFLWSCPDLTADRLVFNVLWTAWIVVGTLLEERDLLAEFGDAYAAYRRQVPMLVPWRGPVAL